MKFSYLTPLGLATLLFGCAIASAQIAPNRPSDQSGTLQRDSPGYSRADGDDLNTTSKSPRDTVSSTPRSTGQDKSTGNDMVSTNGTAKTDVMKRANAGHPDFDTLDTQKKGALTAADVRSNRWLRGHFLRCDTDHDGT